MVSITPWSLSKIFNKALRSTELLHAVLMLHAVYSLNVTGFGDYTYLTYTPWSLKLLLPVSAILDVLVLDPILSLCTCTARSVGRRRRRRSEAPQELALRCLYSQGGQRAETG